MNTVKLTVNVAVDELRDIFSKYGSNALEAAIKKIETDLHFRIMKAVDLPSVQPTGRILVEG